MIEFINSESMVQFLGGLQSFGAYFGTSLIFLIIFKSIYSLVTPYDEWHLIKEERNVAAAIAFGGATLGYGIAISSAASNSVGLLDFALWGCVALVAQIVAFVLVRFLMLPKISERIEKHEVPAATVLASVSIVIGLLNAACMTY
ncbi:DUF350 domain-containing protein [Veronia pacifica]|uniref:DUF350 domain-containing protein n=1 Tax=Veronia pacifica TaxID=1080227 RepID=A0A1C3ESK0_9GAMM|nr:DUF350 domain-containing protein [Veronia pacifica]ODA36277.1 hypothetical protein A8L45_01375 [Veronia pacifica]